MLQQLTTLLNALALTLVAIFGAWIAYRQMRTAKDKLRLDLYDRRMAMYRALILVLESVQDKEHFTYDDYRKFRSDVMGGQWLFDENAAAVLSHVSIKLGQLDLAHSLWDSSQDDMKIERYQADRAEIRKWLLKQRGVVNEPFASHFQFNDRLGSWR